MKIIKKTALALAAGLLTLGAQAQDAGMDKFVGDRWPATSPPARPKTPRWPA